MTNLVALDAVVLAASRDGDVGLVGLGMETGVFESKHLINGLAALVSRMNECTRASVFWSLG